MERCFYGGDMFTIGLLVGILIGVTGTLVVIMIRG